MHLEGAKMFLKATVACLTFTALHAAAAAPALLYSPASGDIWLSGTQQTYGHAALFLNSSSGRLAEVQTALYPVTHPLDSTDSGFDWLHKELSVTLPSEYRDPLYLGSFVSPGTAADDLSARYFFFSFRPRVYFEQALPIQIVPEPATAWTLCIGAIFGVMLCFAEEGGSDRLRNARHQHIV
jgi:hypothetical protein